MNFIQLICSARVYRVCVFVLLSSSLLAAEKAPAKILFIGNSYMGVNQLPNIFKEVVASAGLAEPVIKSSNPGGKTLEQHLKFNNTVALIDEGGWDVVVIQGQSQEASMAQEFDNMHKSFLDGGKALCELIYRKSPQARIVWYQTWARHADYWKAKAPDLAVGKSPDDMMARNRKSYEELANKCPKSTVARAGEAWAKYYQTHPGKELHSGDNSHPTFAGSYLAALVIYQTIYQPATMKSNYHGKLTEELAAELQKTAAANVK